MIERDLCERLGREQQTHALVTTTFDRDMRDEAINNRYVDGDRGDVIRLVTEFICSGTGGQRPIPGVTS